MSKYEGDMSESKPENDYPKNPLTPIKKVVEVENEYFLQRGIEGNKTVGGERSPRKGTVEEAKEEKVQEEEVE